MTANEAIAYINTHTWNLSKPGLERSFELLERLGNPQKKLRFVHVAGTNGKGSTCAMLASILREAGLRVGLYPSPFLEEFRERIQIDGEYISEDDLAAFTAQVAEAADQMEDHPTQFELITAIGFLCFAARGCDIVALEAGMGGALDSTNVIDPPEAAVITRIGLDHTAFLGDTIEAITKTKCGIFKKGSAAVSYANEPEAMDVIEREAAERGLPLYSASAIVLRPVSHDLSGQTFVWENDPDDGPGGAVKDTGRTFRLPLLGAHQIENVRTVLAAVQALRERGLDIPEDAVFRGLESVSWPGRFEVLRQKPAFILDAGHNAQCAEALAQGVRDYLPGRKVTFLIGMLADKDVEAALKFLYPCAERFICVTPDSSRALPAKDLAAMIRAEGYEAEAAKSVTAGAEAALQSGPAVAFGSFYMAGTVRRYVREILKAETAADEGSDRAGR